jgi:ATP-dependent Clp protease adaptor protein ClpS
MSGQFLEEIVKGKTAQSDTKTAVKVPKKFKVILLNDDYTPMDFVVHVLKRFFQLSEEMATQVMLQVHVLGKGVCGVYTRDIAETKVAQVNHVARSNEHPLLCIMEPE